MIEPYCHGSALAVSAQSPTCRACVHARSCLRLAAAFVLTLPDGELALRERKAIALTSRALLNLPLRSEKVRAGQGADTPVAIPQNPRRAPLTGVEVALVASLPQRVASQVKRLLETGWFDFARTELHAGRNPADKGWKRTYCQQLIAGGATREGLRLAFIEQLRLTPASAKVQLSNALAIFAAGDLAIESGGELRLVAKQPD